jgi:hypothetical protein
VKHKEVGFQVSEQNRESTPDRTGGTVEDLSHIRSHSVSLIARN